MQLTNQRTTSCLLDSNWVVFTDLKRRGVKNGEFVIIFIIIHLKIVMECPYCNVDFHPRMDKNN
jgi:hypothetical protein